MNRRLVLAVVLVGVLVAGAGCTTIFGGISDEELDRDQEYDDLRERDADVVIDVESGGIVEGGEFRAVHRLNDTEELSLSRTSYYREVALDVHSVRYWHPNGTEVTGSELEVDQSRSSTRIEVPDGNGTVAFSGEAEARTFSLPAYVEGSYEVILPEGYRTSNLLFGAASPDGYEREVVDDTEHLYWEHNDGTISLRYYRPRDITVFAGVIGVSVVLGGMGIAYYRRQVRRLQEEREELGLDVDVDDSDRGPPPGFR